MTAKMAYNNLSDDKLFSLLQSLPRRTNDYKHVRSILKERGYSLRLIRY